MIRPAVGNSGNFIVLGGENLLPHQTVSKSLCRTSLGECYSAMYGHLPLAKNIKHSCLRTFK